MSHSPTPPERCETISGIRTEIDQIDRQIVSLLGQRLQYVKAAAKFKTSPASVQAPERLESMLKQRRNWACEAGLSADMIERLYRDLVSHFIDAEMNHWQQSTGQASSSKTNELEP